MELREIAERKLYFRYGSTLQGGMSWWYPDKEQPDPENTVVIRDGDCGEVRPTRAISREEFDRRVRDYGLWRSVGLWSFTRADDPAANLIRSCERNPHGAGHRIYRLEERLRRLEWVMTLYDTALARRDEAWVELTHPLRHEPEVDVDYVQSPERTDWEHACARLARIREWLPYPDVIE